MSISKQVELEWAVMELTDHGIVITRYKEGIEVDEHVARSVLAAHMELAGDRVPAPALVCLDRVKGLTRDARKFFAESDEHVAASSHVALLMSSPMARVITNFFLGMSKPRLPTRGFTSEDKAIAWLERHSGGGKK